MGSVSKVTSRSLTYRAAAPRSVSMTAKRCPSARPLAMDRPVHVFPEPDGPWMATVALKPSLVAGRKVNGPSSYSSVWACWFWRPVRTGWPRGLVIRWLLGVLALDPRGQSGHRVGQVAGPFAGLAADGVGVEGDRVEVAADFAGHRVAGRDDHQVGRVLLLQHELERLLRVGHFEGVSGVLVPALLLGVAVLVEGLLQVFAAAGPCRLVVGDLAVVAQPVEAGPSPDAVVLPEGGLFGDSRTGLQEPGGVRVLAQGGGHGLDLLQLVSLERDVAFGADRGDFSLDGIGVPADSVDEDQVGSVVEHEAGCGGAEVERLLGWLRVVQPVLELGRAGAGQLLRAGRGEAAAGDGVRVVQLSVDVVQAGRDLRRLHLHRGGHWFTPRMALAVSGSHSSHRPTLGTNGPSSSPQRVHASGATCFAVSVVLMSPAFGCAGWWVPLPVTWGRVGERDPSEAAARWGKAPDGGSQVSRTGMHTAR